MLSQEQHFLYRYYLAPIMEHIDAIGASFFCYTPNLLARLPIKIRFKGGNHRNNEKRKLFKLIILVKVNTV